MSANNPVFQVLVAPDGDNSVLGAGLTFNDLILGGVGTVGVFSYDTNISVDDTTVVNQREIYIAMAVDSDGDGIADNVVTSAGTHIQRKGVTAYTLKCYTPEQPHIVDITSFSGIKCEDDYAFKVEFRGNSQAYQMFGFNQFAKTFAVRTGCCGPGCDCPSGDCNELALLLFNAVNADTDGIIKAEIIDYTTDGPGVDAIVIADLSNYIDGTAAADVADWVADPANADLCLGIRLISIPSKVYTYCQIPARYYKNVQFKMIVSTLQGLDCNATTTTFQQPSFGEGQGKDIGWLEYEAGGYNGKPGPYRVGELAGIPIGNFERMSTNSGRYNQLNLMYRNESVGGWDEYKNYINTIVAAPCTATNKLLRSIITILDAWLVDNFDALVDDIGQCDCETVLFTSDIDDATLDGLG
jgi:hypothetical protein